MLVKFRNFSSRKKYKILLLNKQREDHVINDVTSRQEPTCGCQKSMKSCQICAKMEVKDHKRTSEASMMNLGSTGSMLAPQNKDKY